MSQSELKSVFIILYICILYKVISQYLYKKYVELYPVVSVYNVFNQTLQCLAHIYAPVAGVVCNIVLSPT